jgi:hypothetical protein
VSHQRKPLFGFLWPRPDTDAPVDGAYRQVRRVRVCGRGPIRVIGLSVLLALTVALLGSTLMAGFASGLTAPGVLLAAVGASGLALGLRGWVVGTYVTDRDIVVETTWRRHVIAWSDVTRIETHELSCPFVGLPIRGTSERSVAVLTDGTRIATHVYATSPDLWLRPEAFDAARIRLENWHASR